METTLVITQQIITISIVIAKLAHNAFERFHTARCQGYRSVIQLYKISANVGGYHQVPKMMIH